VNYYNEFDAKAAAWIRQLIADRLIPPGYVDQRSITEVTAADLRGFTQCHFFAGIGGWSEALRLVGWPATQPIWTGSCPCQPFSAAGKQKGSADKRHLWPEFFRLITECRPPIVFGEQVASKLGREWLSGVRAGLEAVDYAVGSADLCAACAGTPQIRQRLFWVACANGIDSRLTGDAGGAEGARLQSGDHDHGCAGGVGGTECARLEGHTGHVNGGGQSGWVYPNQAGPVAAASRNVDWNDFDILHFTDGKKRRIEPGLVPLAHGLPARVGRIRGYGNAIVPQVAAIFVRSYLETLT
jgi:DNA (cytosine-5)-methyltransferase 1